MAYTLAEIVARFGGRVLGDAQVEITQVATLELADSSQISFLTNSRYRAQLADTKAGALILGEADAEATALPRIISANPYAYFAKVSALLNPLPAIVPGVHPSAVIGAGALIDPTASVAAMAVVGAGAIVGAHSVIGEGSFIGDNVVVGRHIMTV
jgi:UDP-3-O-[3-hydroxymyristoyl] glucosamine N-acyltransferase